MYGLHPAESSVRYLSTPRLMTTHDFVPSPLTESIGAVSSVVQHEDDPALELRRLSAFVFRHLLDVRENFD